MTSAKLDIRREARKLVRLKQRIINTMEDLRCQQLAHNGSVGDSRVHDGTAQAFQSRRPQDRQTVLRVRTHSDRVVVVLELKLLPIQQRLLECALHLCEQRGGRVVRSLAGVAASLILA